VSRLWKSGSKWAAAQSGEAGRGAKPMNEEWVREIKEQCGAADIPFFPGNGAV